MQSRSELISRAAFSALLLLAAACSGKPASGPLARGSLAPGASVAGGAAPAAPSGTTDPGSTANPGTATVAPSAPMQPTMMPMSTLSSREPIAIDQCGAGNPAGLSGPDVDKLRAGGGAPGTIQWLYPYDGTVFPRGMGAPLLMWSGADGDAVYLHIKSKGFEYTACLKPTAPGQVAIPQDVWDKAGRQTYGKGDVYTLELSTWMAGTVTGPVVSHFNIAQATIKGSIYYNSYNSRQSVLPGGIVLRIPACGGAATAFVSTGCNGCHAVSADGSRLVSQFSPGGGASYKLEVGGMANPTAAAAGPRANFGAMYPDGTKYIATSTNVDVARTFMTQAPGAPPGATLFDATNGNALPSTGIPAGALMPHISADGSHLAFNDFAIDQAHGLAIMKYDVHSDTASEYKMLMQEQAGGQLRPGWPFILPDNGGVIFARTDSFDFSGNGAGISGPGGLGAPGGLLPPPPGGPGGGPGLPGAAIPFSELSIVDVTTGTVTLLAQAMGFATPDAALNNMTYLPFGMDELHHNYFPTVSPVAAGGYFWVFFDSLRHYGNLGLQRQLWGTAIDIQPDGSYKLDPSHPAFYVPGQELGTGNHRAFAALDPCKKDGDKCNTGIDCCGGFCYFDKPPEEFVDPVGSCTPKMSMCAKRDERCVSDVDCCNDPKNTMPLSCIAGFCAELPVLN